MHISICTFVHQIHDLVSSASSPPDHFSSNAPPSSDYILHACHVFKYAIPPKTTIRLSPLSYLKFADMELRLLSSTKPKTSLYGV
ncbi:hypothetical protein L2E82_01731 [Cichorium intybus]|uniref:Uncharacterized protein n=1 Tax=Cichorium intybus TaxID=13427 RepID=A0ACB9GZE6_CICIN|nr:hypothetical protein L2E82_01731 [Cichorium intybus]